ncbi:MAG: hypothetical protein K6A65_04800 [Succinivibrionaceae bacterium]|nr:hypothetical protein [Succinivibrionaceae bacterium]
MTLPRLNGQYLFLLPVPISAPGPHGRLAGVVATRTDAALTEVAAREFIPCALPAHLLPDPAYLISQDIDPAALSGRQTEARFYERLRSMLSNPDLDVFTWSGRYLETLDAIALRAFREPGLPLLPRQVVDVSGMLAFCHLFGHLPHPPAASLLGAAAQLGFAGSSGSELFQKLDALLHIVRAVMESDLALLRYALRSRDEIRAVAERAMAGGKPLLRVERLRVHLLRPLAIDAQSLSCIDTDGIEERPLRLPLARHELIAPASVLTPGRERSLGVDAARMAEALRVADPGLIEGCPAPFAKAFMDALLPPERELVLRLRTMEVSNFDPPPITVSAGLRDLILDCKGENAPGALTEGERTAFEERARQLAARDLAAWRHALAALSRRIAPDDSAGQARLQRLMDHAR